MCPKSWLKKASGDSVLQVLENKARKKWPNRPVFTHVHCNAFFRSSGSLGFWHSSEKITGTNGHRTFFGGRKELLVLRPQGSVREPENGNFPKVVRRGCKKCFGPRAPNSSCTVCKKGLHRCKTGFWVVQKTLGRPLLPGSKTPFVPSHTTLSAC